ncbi:MAG: hypothetical protein ACRD2E_08340 [Terriglobales bacterium]
MGWADWVRNAALGVLAASVVDFLQRRSVRTGEWEAMAALASRWTLGAVLAAAYARLVPAEHWGVASGMAFAQLPMVASLRQALAGEGDKNAAARAAEFATWGALSGVLIRYLGARPEGDVEHELVLRLPRRA